ncbi:MAG TPA: hypothetical protein VMC43_00485 [Candidatus Paceibacterota bacterium]|nr:hypothetical protein [Candidatus Paceibacterota bacterium]
MEVYPVINAVDEAEAVGLLARARRLVPPGGWLHIDVADGRFTPHRTFNRLAFWEKIARVYRLEVHLMVEEPEEAVEMWLRAGAARVIIHYEALPERNRGVAINNILDSGRRHKTEVFISTNPETHLHRLRPTLARFDGYQVLAVHPGLSEQKFQWRVLEKITFLRRYFPDATIEVDGGIDSEAACSVKAAGATRVVSASYLWKQVHPEKAYAELLAV